MLLPQALPGMTTSVHLRKFIFHLQTPLQTLAAPSNKHNGKPTSRRVNTRQLRNINTMRCFRIYHCFFFSDPLFPLPRFLHFRPSPGCAVWYRRHPPGSAWMAKPPARIAADWHAEPRPPRRHVAALTAAVLFLISPHPLPYHLSIFGTLLPPFSYSLI